jgi:hypothetical protein
LGGTLLEQAEAVAVAVVEVTQPGFLQCGGHGDDPARWGDSELLSDSDDGGGVGDLVCGVAGQAACGGTCDDAVAGGGARDRGGGALVGGGAADQGVHGLLEDGDD